MNRSIHESNRYPRNIDPRSIDPLTSSISNAQTFPHLDSGAIERCAAAGEMGKSTQSEKKFRRKSSRPAVSSILNRILSVTARADLAAHHRPGSDSGGPILHHCGPQDPCGNYFPWQTLEPTASGIQPRQASNSSL